MHVLNISLKQILKKLEIKIWKNVIWKDCFINMEEHEIIIIKSVFIYKTIYGTTKCMTCFQDVKGFLPDYLHETYSL